MALERHKQQWEELSDLDPYWAILTETTKSRAGQTDLDAFFDSGHMEMQSVMATASQLGYPLARGLALDFGCGVGRLTRALSAHFESCIGVDISERMVAQARELNAAVTNCEFRVNTAPDLRVFADDTFDMLFTARVLQHLPGRSAIKAYLAEFIRTLKPGGLLVFQLPSHIPLRNRFQPRRRAYALLRGLGLSESLLYGRLGLNPIRMEFIPPADVTDFLQTLGGNLLHAHSDDKCGPAIQSRTYYLTK